MFSFRESREIDHPASTVWEYLIAFEQVPVWQEGVREVRQLTPGGPVVGTAVSARWMTAGPETSLRGEVTAIEPGRSATIVLRGGRHVESLVTYSVEPLDDARSRVTYSATGRLRGPLSLLQPMLPALGRATARRNLARLERRIGAGIPPVDAADTRALTDRRWWRWTCDSAGRCGSASSSTT
jgi:uncharacterized protein YndB with AHSA1/START domain